MKCLTGLPPFRLRRMCHARPVVEHTRDPPREDHSRESGNPETRSCHYLSLQLEANLRCMPQWAPNPTSVGAKDLSPLPWITMTTRLSVGRTVAYVWGHAAACPCAGSRIRSDPGHQVTDESGEIPLCAPHVTERSEHAREMMGMLQKVRHNPLPKYFAFRIQDVIDSPQVILQRV